MLKKLEPVPELHEPWKEQTQEDHVKWELHQDDFYTGKYGGEKCSPSNCMQDIALESKTLVEIFIFIFPLSLLSYIAKQTHYYAYEEWVEEVHWLDRDSKMTKHLFVVPI